MVTYNVAMARLDSSVCCIKLIIFFRCTILFKRMLQIDATHMIPGRKYYIKTILGFTIPYNTTLRFKQYYTRSNWDHFKQRSITIQFAEFTCSMSIKGMGYEWGVLIENIKECYAISGSSKEQRDIQLGLLGSLPSGKLIPYDVGRLIASYV